MKSKNLLNYRQKHEAFGETEIKITYVGLKTSFHCPNDFFLVKKPGQDYLAREKKLRFPSKKSEKLIVTTFRGR